MTKFLRSAALMAMLAGGAAGVLTVTNDSVAQDKGTAKDTPKKADKDAPKKGDKAEKDDKDAPKKGDKDAPKKGDKDAPKKGAAVKAGIFEISEGKDKMFRFSIRDADGKFLANSGANKFDTEAEAIKGAEYFKSVIKDAKIEMKKDEK